MRNFIRHPSEFPIELCSHSREMEQQRTRNVSEGGLCCDSRERLEAGTSVHVRIPLGHHAFESEGTVAWCLPSERGYDLGIRFTPGDASRKLQLVELLLRIRRYKAQVFELEGRKLSEEQAAREWLQRETVDLS
jgi:hypothetical protein